MPMCPNCGRLLKGYFKYVAGNPVWIRECSCGWKYDQEKVFTDNKTTIKEISVDNKTNFKLID